MVPCLLVNMAATWRGVGAGSVLSSLNTGPTMTTPRECSSAEGRGWEQQGLLSYKMDFLCKLTAIVGLGGNENTRDVHHADYYIITKNRC